MANLAKSDSTPITWEWLKLTLPLIIALVTIVTFAVGMQNQIDYLDARLCEIEEGRRADAIMSRSIEVRLAEIQRDIAYIRMELDKKQ